MGETLVERVISPINGEITVYDGWFGINMRIGGVTQSGELVEKLWKTGTEEILRHKDIKVLSALILGLGCGDAAKLISKKWPEAKITGIEIDPTVVDVGKKHFGLNSLGNLEVTIGDAIEIMQSAKRKVQNSVQSSKLNLILIDLYVGKEYPKEAESEEFINGVKNLSSENGIVIFNRLCFGEYKKGAENFAEDLKKYFPKVWIKKAITNLLIFCSQ